MSDRSPEETPEETLPADPAPEADEAPASAQEEQGPVGDDETIAALEQDLPADDAAVGPAPIRRKTAQAPVKKASPTRKRKDAEAEHEHVDPYKAKNPAHFVRQSADELKKVVWPTWPALVRYFFAVLAFVLFVIVYVSALDSLFGWSLLQLLGKQ